jgi:hypothetical protein
MIESPTIVNEIVQSVSDKLGREAIFRKVNNREQYFILDLAFSYFQKADRNRRNDYRSGYLYYKINDKNYLLFVLAHSPIMTSFFKKNFNYNIFRSIIVDTCQFRDEHYMRIKRADTQEEIKTNDIKEFLGKLDEIESADFAKSVFAKSKTGKTGDGKIFGIRIGSNFRSEDINKIIEKSWDLFLWLYPSKPIFKRNASLNRSLQKIECKCEINEISNLPDFVSNSPCSGKIEGAHINPHKNGGSDKLENGVWLCNFHHRLTEGKLDGKRGLTIFEVDYKE